MSVTDQLGVVADDAAKPKRKSVLQFEITKKKVPRKDLMHFSRQLAVFIKAGIPILDALETIRGEVTNKYFREVLADILEQLRGGSTFSTAAAAHADAFPPYYIGILASAELTGRLDSVLGQLAEYIERDLEARNKVKSAMTYPIVIMVMSVVVVVILVGFVLPRFEVFFEGLGAELPLPTRLLLGLSAFLTGNAPVLAAGLLALVVLLLVVLRSPAGKRGRDRLLLGLPVVGDLVAHIALERFCRILSALMHAGVPLPEAMDTTAGAVSNHVYRQGIVEAREAMMRGEGLTTPLAATGLFPGSARQMFRVGEDTGTLDEQLETAADYFERELDYKIKRFTNLFEPAILIVVGLVVGFVAIALVSAMYGIFNTSNEL